MRHRIRSEILSDMKIQAEILFCAIALLLMIATGDRVGAVIWALLTTGVSLLILNGPYFWQVSSRVFRNGARVAFAFGVSGVAILPLCVPGATPSDSVWFGTSMFLGALALLPFIVKETP